MEQPTQAQIMDMLIRLDNQMKFVIRHMYFESWLYSQLHPGKINEYPFTEPRWSAFDRLPDQPKDFFNNPEEQTPAPCDKRLSLYACKVGLLDKCKSCEFSLY